MNKVLKTLEIIKRVLALPFVLGLNIIGFIFVLFKICRLWLQHGGELITYHEDRKKIADVYELLKAQEKTTP